MGFSWEQVQEIKVWYLVTNTPSSYNIIIGRLTLNALGVALSTLRLTLKYLLDDVGDGVVKAGQEAATKCYHDSLKTKRKNNYEPPVIASTQDVSFADLDLERISPTRE